VLFHLSYLPPKGQARPRHRDPGFACALPD
jgi:hypothetical protein